uniref:ORF93 protein n=1 Tax=Plutella xylostella granulovirus TaxID=98383 RepID=A0A7U3W5P8_9BBAC|nr:ORF93 protein [Plutella xylostella granulovirus]QKV50136.1 ORF93 protein [Plutella xylostella granulovirus]
MSGKRASNETMTVGGKKALLSSEERVESKKTIRINNKNVYALKIYEAQCTRLIQDKDLFDKIEIGKTYEFTFEKLNNQRLFYIVAYKEMEREERPLCDEVTDKDFTEGKYLKIKGYVVAFYEQPRTNAFSNVRVILCVKKSGLYVQCCMIVDLNSTKLFNFTTEDNNERVTAAFRYFDRIVNICHVFDVKCAEFHVDKDTVQRFNMDINGTIEKGDEDQDADMTECINISCAGTKHYRVIKIKKIVTNVVTYTSKSGQPSSMYKFEIKTEDDEAITACFFINKTLSEEKTIELESLDCNLKDGDEIRVVMYKKFNDNNYVIVSIMCINETEMYTVIV